jgi:hypothetical protein
MTPYASALACLVQALPAPSLPALPGRATLRLIASTTLAAVLLAVACTGCGGGGGGDEAVIRIDVAPLSGGHDAVATAVGIAQGVQIAEGLSDDTPVQLRGDDARLLGAVAQRLAAGGMRNVVQVLR